LLRDARVERVEPDGVVTTQAVTQSSAPWGLDRTDQVSLPLSTTYVYGSTGANVNAYIIDTGIRFDHQDFGGRAISGVDKVDGGTADDCNGHGTHVAGTVGGEKYGIAKNVKLIAVRVLDCGGSGSWSGVIGGMDWVAANHQSPAVANMSLGGGASASVDDALRRLIGSGVTVGVAAGNGNRGGRQQDACGYSPARVREAITVGATDKTDTKTSWSNYGDCVDLFAPGSAILSAWYTGATAFNTISGTSMATPHVVGVAARYLGGNPGATPAQVATAILGAATDGKVNKSYTANNDLLYWAP
jgi:subtilisin family serine protease